jgi:2-methylcitrate dehydratase PrpD
VAEGAYVEAADLGLNELEHRHISELHELAAAAGVPRFRTLRRDELAAAINSALQGEVAPSQVTAPRTAFAVIKLERGSRWTPGPKPDQVRVEKIVSTEE